MPAAIARTRSLHGGATWTVKGVDAKALARWFNHRRDAADPAWASPRPARTLAYAALSAKEMFAKEMFKESEKWVAFDCGLACCLL